MKGTVKLINPQNGMLAVLTADGAFTLIEPLGDDLEIGDAVSWAGDRPLGHDTLNNHTRGERYEVFFQDHDVTAAALKLKGF